MELKKISAGRLRGIGYDEKAHCLRVQLDDGSLLEYAGITLEMWRRFSASTAPWSYYLDNIADELTPRRLDVANTDNAGNSASSGSGKRNPLDDLFS
jgi:hypothetical protein